jgi:uncharacterized protein YbaR (Trm112 family)
MSELDYERCSLNELLDVKEHIDKDAYPDRYKEVLRQIELKEQEAGPGEFPPSCHVCLSFLEERKVKPHIGAGKTMIAYLAGNLVFDVLFFATVGCWIFMPIGYATVASIIVSFYVLYLFKKEQTILVCPSCKREYSIWDFET